MNNEKDVYSLSVKLIGGIKRYYVTFSDVSGSKHTVEIDCDVYTEFVSFGKEIKSQEYYFGRYIEHQSMSDEALHKRIFADQELTDEQIIKKQYHRVLYKSINNLPEKQRRRFMLYFEHDLTYKEIAEIECCSVVSVKQVIDRAKETIIQDLKKY